MKTWESSSRWSIAVWAMCNPYHAPRPRPISPDRMDDGCSLDELMEASSIHALLDDNFEWLQYREPTTREVYLALYSGVDPQGSRMRDGMNYLNQALWNLGFRTVGKRPHPTNPSWKWIGPS